MESLKLRIPTTTLQLKPKQLRAISLLLLMGYTETEFLVKALLKLSGLKVVVDMPKEPDGAHWYKHRSLKKPFILSAEQLAQMANKCAFLLTPSEIKPLPWIKFAHARHYRLYNARFEEYLMAENYYFAFMQTNDPAHLDNLIAVLYRRPWHRWNAEKIQQRAIIFKNVAPEVKNTVFMWYTAFRKLIEQKCPNLYSQKGSGKANVSEYVNGMVHALNNNDITKNKTLLKQATWDAINELEQRALEAVKMKETLENK